MRQFGNARAPSVSALSSRKIEKYAPGATDLRENVAEDFPVLYQHVYWPSGLGHHEDRTTTLHLSDVHYLYFRKAPNDDEVRNAVALVLSGLGEDQTPNNCEGCEDLVEFLSSFGRVTKVFGGVHVSESTFFKAAFASLTLGRWRKILKSFVKSSSAIKLSCTTENEFVKRSWTTKRILTSCSVSVEIFLERHQIGAYSFFLDRDSRQLMQDIVNTKDHVSADHQKLQTAFIQSDYHNAPLQKQELRGPSGTGRIVVDRRIRQIQQEVEVDASSLRYWIGRWREWTWILPGIHAALALSTMVYLIFLYFFNQKNNTLLDDRRRECEQAGVNMRKGHGCGPNPMLRVVPMRRSLFAIVLGSAWFVLFVATVVFVYLLHFDARSFGTIVSSNFWSQPLLDSPQYPFYMNCILALLIFEICFFICAQRFDFLRTAMLRVVVDAAHASHVIVEEYEPRHGTATAVSVVSDAANVADPSTTEDRILEKKNEIEQQQHNVSAALSTRQYGVSEQATAGSCFSISKSYSRDQVITRALHPAHQCNPILIGPPTNSGQHIDSADVIQVSKSLACVRCQSSFTSDADQPIVRFVHRGVQYVWNPDLLYFEKYDFEWEAIRLANLRLRSGMSSMLAARRQWYAGNEILGPSDIVRWSLACLHVLFRPYVLITFASCLVVVPRWDIFWVLSFLVFLLVSCCYISSRPKHGVPNSEPHIRVLRDGQVKWMSSAQLVPGDITYLSGELTIPARVDLVLLTNSAVVQEVGLTGDLNPQEKYPLVHKKSKNGTKLYPYNRIWGGGRILYAHSQTIAVVTRVNGSSQQGQMLHKPVHIEGTCTAAEQFRRQLRVVLCLVFVVYLSMWISRSSHFGVANFQGTDVPGGVQAVIVLLFVTQDFLYNELPWFCIDCGVILLCYFVCRYVARHRLKCAGITCQTLESIPVAGRVNVMVFDKTCTLTESEMCLSSVIPAGAVEFQDPLSCEDFKRKVTPDIDLAMACCHRLIHAPNGETHGNSLEKTMFVASGWKLASQDFNSILYILPPEGSSSRPIEVLHTICFDASDGTSGVIVQHGEEVLLFVKGGLESILSRCNPMFDRKKALRISTDGKYSTSLAMRKLDPSVLRKLKKIPRKTLIDDLDMVALLLFTNRVRPESADVINQLHSTNRSTVMATGDHTQTAIDVARQVGIISQHTDVYVPTIIGEVHLLPPLEPKKHIKTPALWTNRFIIGDQPGDFDWHPDEQEDIRVLPTIEEESDSISSDLEVDGHVCAGDAQPHSVVWRNAQTNEVVDQQLVFNAKPGALNLVLTGPALCRLQQLVAIEEHNGQSSDMFKRILPNLRVCSRMSPSDKAQVVEMLRQEGNVVGFCGDGYNDGPALSVADIGISLNGDQDLSSMSSFSTSDASVDVVTTVLAHGQTCMANTIIAFLFGVLQVLFKTFGRMILEGARQVLHSSMLLRTDNVLLFFIVFLALSIPLLPRSLQLHCTSSVRDFMRPSFAIWILSQVAICFGGFIVLRVVAMKNASIRFEDLQWVSQSGFTALYDIRINTPEVVVMCLASIWMLCTFILCAFLAQRRCHGTASQLGVLVAVVCSIKLFVLLLLWSGPSTFSCWLGINCDNTHSYRFTGSCLYGPQVLALNRKLGESFCVPRPTAESRCRFHDGQLPSGMPVPQPLVISIFPSSFWRHECHAPHNCVPTYVRWQVSIILAITTFVSAIPSLLLSYVSQGNSS